MHLNKTLMGNKFKKKYQNLVISKSQNKVNGAEEIGCGNELKYLQKIGRGNVMRFN